MPLLNSLRIGLSFYNFYSKNPYVQAQRHILGQPTAEIDIFALFLIFLLIFFEFGVANHLNLLVKDFQILTFAKGRLLFDLSVYGGLNLKIFV